MIHAAPLQHGGATPLIGREAAASLRFAHGGGGTVLIRQHVPYPMHITRPFRLDAGRPDLVTLYLQSASGGLYRGDRLSLSAALETGSAVHLTTQAATVVHDTRGVAAAQTVRIRTAPDTLLAFTPDPVILFPGADYIGRTEITLADAALAIVTEGFAWHDPAGAGRSFGALSLATIVRDARGRELVADRSEIDGASLSRAASPLGPYRAFASMFVLGGGERSPSPLQLDAVDLGPGCRGAASRLPNQAGIGYRVLAENGGALARAMRAVFLEAFTHILGFPPAPRRK